MPFATSRKTGPTRDMRQHILDTALLLFTRDGYFNTSVHDIQREADISIGSIYNHFGGKEGIARALYESLLLQMGDLVEQAILDHTTAYSRGKAVVEAMFAMTESMPETMRFIFGAKHTEFLPDESPICSARPFMRLRDIVKDGIDSGEVREMDPWIAASCTFGPALRMITLRLDGLLPDDLSKQADAVWDTAWSAVAADEALG